MKEVLKIIDSYLTFLLSSNPSPDLKITLRLLVNELKKLNYPKVELVDIISIRIILDYILSDVHLIRIYAPLIKRGFLLISDILGDGLYVKIEPKIIAFEYEFYTNICPNRRQFENRLAEEIRNLLLKK